MDNFYMPCQMPMYRHNPNYNMFPPMPEMQLARAYIPDQPYTGLFPLSEAMKKGTIFPNLYIPFPIKSKE